MSKDLLFDVYSMAQNQKVIDDELINFVDSIFPNKVEKVLEVIKRGITKYNYRPSNRIIWVALGKDCEHLISLSRTKYFFYSTLQINIHLPYVISDDNYIHQILRSLINIARLT